MTASPVELPQLPPKPWIWELPSGNLARIMRGDFPYPEQDTRLHAEQDVLLWGQQCYEAGVRSCASGGTLFVKSDARNYMARKDE